MAQKVIVLLEKNIEKNPEDQNLKNVLQCFAEDISQEYMMKFSFEEWSKVLGKDHIVLAMILSKIKAEKIISQPSLSAILPQVIDCPKVAVNEESSPLLRRRKRSPEKPESNGLFNKKKKLNTNDKEVIFNPAVNLSGTRSSSLNNFTINVASGNSVSKQPPKLISAKVLIPNLVKNIPWWTFFLAIYQHYIAKGYNYEKILKNLWENIICENQMENTKKIYQIFIKFCINQKLMNYNFFRQLQKAKCNAPGYIKFLFGERAINLNDLSFNDCCSLSSIFIKNVDCLVGQEAALIAFMNGLCK